MYALKLANLMLFLSTLSLRRATANNQTEQQAQHISIHALLAESDLAVPDLGKRDIRFLSTLSLRRATTAFQKLMAALLQFLSTLSLRRATNSISDSAV